MLLLNFCQETVKGWKIAGILVLILRIMVPIIVIITCMVPFLDAVLKGNSDSLVGAGKTLFRKLLAAIIVFFIPTVINASIHLLSNRDVVEEDMEICSLCLDKPNGDECNKKIADFEQSLKDEVIKFKEEEINGSVDTSNMKEAEKESSPTGEVINNGNNTPSGSNNNTSPAGSTNSNVKGTVNIIIGDSRTVGMCATYTGDWSGCNTGSPLVSGKDIYVSKGSMGYSWFESTAIPNVNSILSSNSGTTYNIISLMGVNFLLSDIDKYIPKYNELATGSWSKHRIILVSVNPVNEAVEATYGYSTRNADIETFNTKLKNGTSGKGNMTYCDVYNQIKGGFGTGDGLHYDETTYQTIYNKIMECV